MELKDLEESLGKKETALQHEELREKAHEKRERAINQKAGRREHGLRSEKLKLAEQIFGWAAEFTQTRAYKRLLKIAKEYPHMRDYIEIHADGWGHEAKYTDDNGCWSYISLYPNGSLAYEEGYKWMGVHNRLAFNSPKDLTDKLNHAYLTKLAAEIKSGKTYDWIKEQYCTDDDDD